MVSNLLPPPTQLLVDPRSGAVDEAWYRFFDTLSSTIDDLSADSGGGLTALFPLGSTKLYRATNDQPYELGDDGSTTAGFEGQLKYQPWWTTITAVHRLTKPTHTFFQGAWITIVGGGGGGGTSTNTVSPSAGNIGGGGAGGGWARKWLAEADWPDELVLVVGKGGKGGGQPESGTTEADGEDGAVTAVLTSTAFDAYAGATDLLKADTLQGRTFAQLSSETIFWVDAGEGGLSGDNESYTNQRGVKSNPAGVDTVFGDIADWGDDDLIFGGAYGGGEGSGIEVDTAPLDDYSVGGVGAGGSAGRIYDNIWSMLSHGAGGLVSRLAGNGAPSHGALGAGTLHQGRSGSLFGGGGGGGTKLEGNATGNAIRGGMGAPGVAEVELYFDETDTHGG